MSIHPETNNTIEVSMLSTAKRLTHPMSRLGDYIRDLRESKGYSQRTLALKALISNEALRRIEIGQTKYPSTDLIIRLSQVLNIKPNVLIDLIKQDMVDNLDI